MSPEGGLAPYWRSTKLNLGRTFLILNHGHTFRSTAARCLNCPEPHPDIASHAGSRYARACRHSPYDEVLCSARQRRLNYFRGHRHQSRGAGLAVCRRPLESRADRCMEASDGRRSWTGWTHRCPALAHGPNGPHQCLRCATGVGVGHASSGQCPHIQRETATRAGSRLTV
jgi:hypothetical protein